MIDASKWTEFHGPAPIPVSASTIVDLLLIDGAVLSGIPAAPLSGEVFVGSNGRHYAMTYTPGQTNPRWWGDSIIGWRKHEKVVSVLDLHLGAEYQEALARAIAKTFAVPKNPL